MRSIEKALAVVVALVGALAFAGDKRGDVKVTVKAGVGAFTGDLSEGSSAGPVWGAAVTLQPIKALGIELGYEGSRFSLTDREFLSTEHPALTRHGGSALLKLAPPFIEFIKPFVGVGLGASYVGVTQSPSGYRGDFMEEVPFAAGLELNTFALTAGMRATYRVLLDEGFAVSAGSNRDVQGGLFDVAATLGGRF